MRLVSNKSGRTDMLLVFLTITQVLLVSSVGQQFCKRRVCYFSSSAQRRTTQNSSFYPEEIDTNLCSHIIYRYATLTANSITPLDPLDESTDSQIGSYEGVTHLKQATTSLKVLLALRVTPRDSQDFVTVTSSDSSLREFSDNVVQFLRDRDFDGLDFQFFIYGSRKTSPDIKNKISIVLEQLRRAFDEEKSGSDRLLLTAAVYGEKVLEHESFDVQTISQTVDWIHLLAVDLNGPWHRSTGHHVPLFPDLTNTAGWDTLYNVDKAVKHWIDGGAPKDKIVLALSFYGRSFRLTSSDTGVGAPAKEGIRSKYTGFLDDIAYFEICELKDQGLHKHVFLTEQGATYLVSGDVWISYEDVDSVRQKVRYIRENGLGGFVAYSIDEDDVLGLFCDNGPYPLLRAANLECTL